MGTSMIRFTPDWTWINYQSLCFHYLWTKNIIVGSVEYAVQDIVTWALSFTTECWELHEFTLTTSQTPPCKSHNPTNRLPHHQLKCWHLSKSRLLEPQPHSTQSIQPRFLTTTTTAFSFSIFSLPTRRASNITTRHVSPAGRRGLR